jgi:hypothetical protein
MRLADGRSVVLRRYSWEDFLRDEPDAPVREASALDYAARHRLPAPALLAVDVDGEQIGDGVPAIVMARLPGRAHSSPDVAQLAATVAKIHEANTGADLPAAVCASGLPSGQRAVVSRHAERSRGLGECLRGATWDRHCYLSLEPCRLGGHGGE